MKWISNNKWMRGICNLLCCALLFTIFHQKSMGQEKPPRPIDLLVRTEQGLQFGAFTYGPGTVTVLPTGGRTCIDVIPVSLGYNVSPAWIQVKGNPGTLVTILITSSYIANSGFQVPLTFNTPNPISFPSSPFILTDKNWKDIKIGGTLTVGPSSSNPAGSYSGTFNVTFIQN